MSTRPQEKTEREAKPDAPDIYACVDQSETSLKVIPVAKAIAKALGGVVTLVHVIDPTEFAHAPLDPVDWEIVRREARKFTTDLASDFASAEEEIEARVLEGRRAEKICGCGAETNEDIIAICPGDMAEFGEFGFTARRVMETSPNSLLMVPASMPNVSEARFRRVLVPLDGSAQAESAIPIAAKIAVSENAELVLVHATPEPALTHAGPLGVKDNELIDQIRRRNESVARDYLVRTKSHLGTELPEITPLILKGGDVRRLLTEKAILGPDDLVVLASHGHSGFTDVPFGDVANFIIAHSDAPVLMVRRPRQGKDDHIYSEARSKGVRQPTAEI